MRIWVVPQDLQIPVPFVWGRNLFIFHGGKYDDFDKAMAMAVRILSRLPTKPIN
jgi:hypothetical protein